MAIPVQTSVQSSPSPSSQIETLDLSVVVPVYNEEGNIAPLHEQLHSALSTLERSYEIIYINDGSRDTSFGRLKEMAAAYPETVRVIDFRRNFGQTAALAAGLDYARGEVLVLMDADLQNDPADIPRLLEMIDDGYDVVSGWRKDRKDPFLRRLPSRMANWLISTVTGVRLHDYGCTLKAYRREVASEVRLYGQMHRFIPIYAAAAGARIAELVVNHRPRTRGKSKAGGLMRTGKVILDLMTVKFLLSFRTTPMYLFGGSGLALIGLGALTILIALLNRWLRGIYLIQTPLPVLSAVFTMMGFQSILMGLTTELLVRTYHEASGRPIYVVRRTLNIGD